MERSKTLEECLICCVKENYVLEITHVKLLPLGFGLDTVIYRVTSENGAAFFCKLKKRDSFNANSVEIPNFLRENGISQILPPVTTRNGELYVNLGMEEFILLVYPFIEGNDGYNVQLTEMQWKQFGAALKMIHTIALPSKFVCNLKKDDFASTYQERCKQYMNCIDSEYFSDPISISLALLFQSHRERIFQLINGAEQLACSMRDRSLKYVLCHSDLHPGNVYISTEGIVFIVDWDWLSLSPKERDLMQIGGGHKYMGWEHEKQEILFQKGYGELQIDQISLAYYRYERNVMAITLACDEILSNSGNNRMRSQCLEYLEYYFLPLGPIEIALKSKELE